MKSTLKKEDIAEILQECFLKAFSKKARISFDGLRTYRPYLLRIAKNIIIDRARAKREVLISEHFEEFCDFEKVNFEENIPLEEELIKKELKEKAKEYLLRLDEQNRKFVKLRFWEEKSQREIAKIMSLSRRQIMKIEKTVLKGLRKYLKKPDPKHNFTRK